MLKTFVATLRDPKATSQSAKVALIVGTILFGINHGQAFLQQNMRRDRWIAAGITYFVPFTVSLHGQAMSRYRQSRR
jgi:hypothetical protein